MAILELKRDAYNEIVIMKNEGAHFDYISSF